MKKTLIALALATPLLASAQNALTDGSFDFGLTSWSVSGIAPEVIATPGVKFGDSISADNSASASPDAAGSTAVMFYEDTSSQGLSQTFAAAAGSYLAGFSYYVTPAGFGNPFDSTLSFMVDNTTVLTTTVGALGVSNGWVAWSAPVSLVGASHTFSLSLAPGGVNSKDIVIDRAFVTAVPEPETYALMLAGLAGVGFMARRRARG